MAKHLQIVVNDAFWYEGDRNGGRLCSYRQAGNTPKYQITLIRDGGVVLDIFPDDHPKHKFFDPTEEADPIRQAMRYAEGYDAEHYPPSPGKRENIAISIDAVLGRRKDRR